MPQVLLVTVLVIAGGGLCVWLRTGRYRRPGEHAPLPAHLWVVPATLVVGALVAHGLADRGWPVLPPYLVLAVAGVALAAIDTDVHRLPNAITLPLVPLLLVLLGTASAATGGWTSLRRAVVATALLGGGALLLALLPGHPLGMGDAKLLVSLVGALAWLSWSHVLVGLALGFVIGGVMALALVLTRRVPAATRLAFGPGLLVGALLAVLLG